MAPVRGSAFARELRPRPKRNGSARRSGGGSDTAVRDAGTSRVILAARRLQEYAVKLNDGKRSRERARRVQKAEEVPKIALL
jgi:hypothetical protein